MTRVTLLCPSSCSCLKPQTGGILVESCETLTRTLSGSVVVFICCHLVILSAKREWFI